MDINSVYNQSYQAGSMTPTFIETSYDDYAKPAADATKAHQDVLKFLQELLSLIDTIGSNLNEENDKESYQTFLKNKNFLENSTNDLLQNGLSTRLFNDLNTVRKTYGAEMVPIANAIQRREKDKEYIINTSKEDSFNVFNWDPSAESVDFYVKNPNFQTIGIKGSSIIENARQAFLPIKDALVRDPLAIKVADGFIQLIDTKGLFLGEASDFMSLVDQYINDHGSGLNDKAKKELENSFGSLFAVFKNAVKDVNLDLWNDNKYKDKAQKEIMHWVNTGATKAIGTYDRKVSPFNPYTGNTGGSGSGGSSGGGADKDDSTSVLFEPDSSIEETPEYVGKFKEKYPKFFENQDQEGNSTFINSYNGHYAKVFGSDIKNENGYYVVLDSNKELVEVDENGNNKKGEFVAVPNTGLKGRWKYYEDFFNTEYEYGSHTGNEITLVFNTNKGNITDNDISQLLERLEKIQIIDKTEKEKLYDTYKNKRDSFKSNEELEKWFENILINTIKNKQKDIKKQLNDEQKLLNDSYDALRDFSLAIVGTKYGDAANIHEGLLERKSNDPSMDFYNKNANTIKRILEARLNLLSCTNLLKLNTFKFRDPETEKKSTAFLDNIKEPTNVNFVAIGNKGQQKIEKTGAFEESFSRIINELHGLTEDGKGKMDKPNLMWNIKYGFVISTHYDDIILDWALDPSNNSHLLLINCGATEDINKLQNEIYNYLFDLYPYADTNANSSGNKPRDDSQKGIMKLSNFKTIIEGNGFTVNNLLGNKGVDNGKYNSKAQAEGDWRLIIGQADGYGIHFDDFGTNGQIKYLTVVVDQPGETIYGCADKSHTIQQGDMFKIICIPSGAENVKWNIYITDTSDFTNGNRGQFTSRLLELIGEDRMLNLTLSTNNDNDRHESNNGRMTIAE